MEAFLLAMLLSVPIQLLSYCAAWLALPLADGRLAAMDRALGVHAPAIVSMVSRSPLLSDLLKLAYGSFIAQILILPPILTLLGDARRGYMLVTSYAGVCLLSIAISVFFPAVATFQHFGLSAPDLGAVDPFFGRHFLASFHGVRSNPHFKISLHVASGIITIPSIHAGVAVLCTWAAIGRRALFVPVAILNVLMFRSAITHGAHYVVDTVAGRAVAALVTGCVRFACRPRLAAPPPSPAEPAAATAAR